MGLLTSFQCILYFTLILKRQSAQVHIYCFCHMHSFCIKWKLIWISRVPTSIFSLHCLYICKIQETRQCWFSRVKDIAIFFIILAEVLSPTLSRLSAIQSTNNVYLFALNCIVKDWILQILSLKYNFLYKYSYQ